MKAPEARVWPWRWRPKRPRSIKIQALALPKTTAQRARTYCLRRRRSMSECTLHRAPVGQGPSGPDWLAISFGFWSGRALATGTAWAGLCLIHHQRSMSESHQRFFKGISAQNQWLVDGELKDNGLFEEPMDVIKGVLSLSNAHHLARMPDTKIGEWGSLTEYMTSIIARDDGTTAAHSSQDDNTADCIGFDEDDHAEQYEDTQEYEQAQDHLKARSDVGRQLNPAGKGALVRLIALDYV